MKEFKAFILRGNVIDMAVGIIIGAAFGAIVSSLVKDIIMPPIGLALGNIDFSNLFVLLKPGAIPGPYESLKVAQDAGAVSINYGLFINTLIIFIIIALVVFFLIVKPVSRLTTKPAAPPATKECSYCFTNIPIKAARCPNCTSQLVK